MEGKSKIRSIRFTPELYELIDRQEGDTFTQKLENLVTRCVWELPKREKELKYVQTQIRNEWAKLDRIRREANLLETTINSLSGIADRARYQVAENIKRLDELLKESS